MNGTVQKLIIGLIVVVLLGSFVIAALMGAAVYNWKAAVRAGNEAATLQDLKTIAAVEIQYYNTHNHTFGTFDQMIRERMLNARFSEDPPNGDGYFFRLTIVPTKSARPGSYVLNADPKSGRDGKSHFYIDSMSGEIHVNADRPAGPSDPPIGG